MRREEGQCASLGHASIYHGKSGHAVGISCIENNIAFRPARTLASMSILARVCIKPPVVVKKGAGRSTLLGGPIPAERGGGLGIRPTLRPPCQVLGTDKRS